MTVPFRTFAAFGLALGMLGAGYLFVPAPGGATSPAQPVAKAEPAPARPAPELVASRPPVPLLTPPRATYVSQATLEKSASNSSEAKPSVNAGVFKSGAPDPNVPTQALAMAPPSGDDSQAKRGGNDSKARQAIELDGYKNVRGLEQGPDGMWHGRALRGRTEIAVRVDSSGNVSAE
jgi:hypothetical protein